MSTQMPTIPQALQPIDIIRAKIANLATALEARLPTYKTILQDIHSSTHANESLIYLLSAEEIGTMTASLMHVAQLQIAEAKVKVASKKKSTNISLDI